MICYQDGYYTNKYTYNNYTDACSNMAKLFKLWTCDFKIGYTDYPLYSVVNLKYLTIFEPNPTSISHFLMVLTVNNLNFTGFSALWFSLNLSLPKLTQAGQTHQEIAAVSRYFTLGICPLCPSVVISIKYKLFA